MKCFSCVSAFREGQTFKPPPLSSTHSFPVWTLMHSKRIQTIFSLHNLVCSSGPDREGRKSAWSFPLPQAGAFQGPGKGHGNRSQETWSLFCLSLDLTVHLCICILIYMSQRPGHVMFWSTGLASDPLGVHSPQLPPSTQLRSCYGASLSSPAFRLGIITASSWWGAVGV